MRVSHCACLALCALASLASLAAQSADYIVGPQDIVTVTLWDQPDMSGKYTVEQDGTVALPMLGRVKVGGLRVREIESDLKRRLGDGFFKNPQLSVAVEPHRSERVVVFGEVRTPGTVPFTTGMTVIEALAHAGATTPEAAGEALVVREGRVPANGEAQDDEPTASEVLRVDLRKLTSGVIAENIRLRNGDTIVVPRMGNIFVMGQVRAPGSYLAHRETTVLQAISLAGGPTERGSTGRLRILRVLNGKPTEIKVKPTDLVQPGDTIVVLERIL